MLNCPFNNNNNNKFKGEAVRKVNYLTTQGQTTTLTVD